MSPSTEETTDPRRWPAERVRAWFDARPRVVGCNYLPRSAVNATEMWQAATFDPDTIEEELGWARALGYDGLRVFLSHMAWREDEAGAMDRLERFLDIAAGRGQAVLPVLFDDVAFSGRQPYPGPQDDPAPGVHNSAWVPCPGHEIVADPARWSEAHDFLDAVMARFGRDGRMIGWDLFNEPGNGGMGESSLPFMDAAFDWARDAAPDHPLTTGGWTGLGGEFTPAMWDLALGRSDVVTFHSYADAASVRAVVDACRARSDGRPMLCTEWLHRPRRNTFADVFPIFEEAGIGWYHWGLVAGRTQTNLLWDWDKGKMSGDLWLADVLRPDGAPYDPAEMALLAAHAERVRRAVPGVPA